MSKNKGSKIKVAFFIGIFPKISESWFIEQTTSLLDMGVDISIFAFEKGGPANISEKVRKYRLLERTTYLSYPHSILDKLLLAPYFILKLLVLDPKALIRLFRADRSGRAGFSLKHLFWAAPLAGKMDKYDLIHCHFGMTANKYLALKDIFALKQPLVVTLYGQDSSKYIVSKGPRVYDRLKAEASMILTMTSEMNERMAAFGFAPEKLMVNYTGIVPENYVFTEKRHSPGEEFRMIFVGRFVEKKGLEDLFRMAGVLKKSRSDFKIYVVGDADDAAYRKSLVSLIAELGVEANIVLLGLKPHQDTLELFKDMHLSVQLSRRAQNGDTDDLPFVLLEAQMSGLPVVTTRHVGIPDGVSDGRSGFLVNEGDYGAAADRVLCLMENPDHLREMSRQAHDFVRSKFNLWEINKKLISLYYLLTKR